MSNTYVELLYMPNSHAWTTMPLPFIKNLLNHLVSHLMKARELQENLLNDMERFSSEEESSTGEALRILICLFRKSKMKTDDKFLKLASHRGENVASDNVQNLVKEIIAYARGNTPSELLGDDSNIAEAFRYYLYKGEKK